MDITSKNEVVNYFDKTNVDWKIKTTSSLLDFYFHTRQYLSAFNFATVDGLDNMRSNIHTLLKECGSELRIRGIKVD